MKNLSVKWQKLIVWLTGYLNIIAFVIAGGYLYINTEQGEVKNSAKVALFATAVFTAVDIALIFVRNCVYLAKAVTDWIVTTGWVLTIVKIVVFVILFIVDMTVGFGGAAQNGATSLEKCETQTDEDGNGQNAE